MANVFDYLNWRGDLTFTQDPPNAVDALVFSALSYIPYCGRAMEDPRTPITLRDAAEEYFALENYEALARAKMDIELLHAAAKTTRFGLNKLFLYRSQLIPEQDTQFAAVTFLLDDGSLFLAFRGTDNTLVGWKEDFNMTFQESVPAQRLAQEYVCRLAAVHSGPMYLGGHSKGGNLAVYAGAKCPEEIQSRLIQVFNHDGPGFTEAMMSDPGYLRIIPRVRTLVPQSSVFGMLLEHEEAYTVIRSRSVGVFQHDPYSWEIMGPAFIPVEDRTADSRFLDRTFRTWLAGMTPAERNEFFDAVFDLLMMENASRPRDLMRPQHLRTLLRTIQMDEEKRRLIASVLIDLVESARNTHIEMTE